MRTSSFTSREVCNNNVLEEENGSLPSDAISEAGSISSTMSLEKRRAAAIARKRGLEQKYKFMKEKLQRETEMKLKLMELEFQIEENDIDTELKVIKALESGTGSAETSLPARSHNACGICKANHEAIDCTFLLEKSPEERFKLIHRSRLCLNCLMGGHVAKECKVDAQCKVASCGRKHCTILHQNGWKTRATRHCPVNVNNQEKPEVVKCVEGLTGALKKDILRDTLTESNNKKEASKSGKPLPDQRAENERIPWFANTNRSVKKESLSQNRTTVDIEGRRFGEAPGENKEINKIKECSTAQVDQERVQLGVQRTRDEVFQNVDGMPLRKRETASITSKSSSVKPSRSQAERKEAIAFAFKKETEKSEDLIRKYEIEIKKLDEMDKEDLRIIGGSK